MTPNGNGCGNCRGCGKVSRRTVLGGLVGLINVAMASAVVGPVVGFIASPLRGGKVRGRWIPVLDLRELQDGETRAVDYEVSVEDGYMTADRVYSVYLQRKRGKVVAYDPTCPHLGCHVEYKERKRRYVCPCHGGVFDEDGKHLSGPPPRGLTKIATKVEDGKVWLYKV